MANISIPITIIWIIYNIIFMPKYSLTCLCSLFLLLPPAIGNFWYHDYYRYRLVSWNHKICTTVSIFWDFFHIIACINKFFLLLSNPPLCELTIIFLRCLFFVDIYLGYFEFGDILTKWCENLYTSLFVNKNEWVNILNTYFPVFW